MLITQGEPQPTRLEDLLPPELAARLDRLDVLSRKVFAGKLPGERRSKRRGQSVEFDDYRQYTPGDDLRHVDWNVFARLDRFFVKLFREDEDLVVHLAVDLSPSMQGGAVPGSSAGSDRPVPSKALFAKRLAMTLGYLALVNQNRVVVEIFGDSQPRRLAPIRGRRQTDRLAAFLLAEPDRPEDPTRHQQAEPFDASMRRLANARKGNGLAVVLSDFLAQDDLEPGLNYLHAGQSFDAACLQILSPGELDPETEMPRGLRGDVRLTDAESAKAAEVTVGRALLDRYHKRLHAHLDRVAELCRIRGFRHAVLNTQTPIEDVVLDALRRHHLVG